MLRSCTARLAEILMVIQASADSWGVKVDKGRTRAQNAIAASAKQHGFDFDVCPNSPHCDAGSLMSRRLGMHFPCPHTVAKHDWEHAPAPVSPLSWDRDSHVIEIEVQPAEWNWQWSRTATKKRHGAPIVEDSPIDDAEYNTSEGRLVSRTMREMHMLGHGSFRYQWEELFHKHGELQGIVKERYGATVSDDQCRARANSEFFIECVRVVKDKRAWTL
jgi:hypothetical protein